MRLRKVIIDTNVYVDWLNGGLHEGVMLGAGLVRHLSCVVQMELRAGAITLPARRALDQLVRAYRSAGRVVTPTPQVFDEAGQMLQRLRGDGCEVRRSSLVNDVLIALTARAIGASVVTGDEDFEAIRSVVDFQIEKL